MKYLSIFILIAVLIIGVLSCVATPTPPERYPPLPESITFLWQQLGEPEIHPGVAMVLVWTVGEESLFVLLAYDPFRGWIIDQYWGAGTSTIPSEWDVALYEAISTVRDWEIPCDPWGIAITDSRVLQPEVR